MLSCVVLYTLYIPMGWLSDTDHIHPLTLVTKDPWPLKGIVLAEAILAYILHSLTNTVHNKLHMVRKMVST